MPGRGSALRPPQPEVPTNHEDAPTPDAEDTARLDLMAVRAALVAYTGAPGVLCVWSLPSKRSRSFDTDAAGIAAAVDYVRDLDVQGATSIYHQGTTMRAPVDPAGRGTAADARTWLRVQLDADFGKPGYAPDAATVRALIERAQVPPPSAYVHSGHGLYPQWEITPAAPGSPDVRALALDVDAAVRTTFAAAGYKLDQCSDAARVWRLPGTVNRKDPAAPVACRLIERSGEVYALAELRAAVPARAVQTPTQGDVNTPQTDRTFTEQQAADYIERYALAPLRTAQDGSINNTLNTAAVVVGHFVPEFGDEQAARARLLAELAHTGYDHPPSAEATITSGLRKGMGEPYRRRAEPSAATPAGADEVTTEHRPALEFQTFADLAAEVDAAGPRRWLIRGIWPAGDYGLLAAESKAQKTWNAADLAVSVASGRPWLGGIEIDTPGPVLLFVGEGGKGNIVRRIRAVAVHRAVDPDTLPIVICARAPRLGDDVHMGALAEQVERMRPALVIIDPLYLSAQGGNIADLYGMGELLERPQHICQAYGASLLVVHHFNRKVGNGRDRMSGAGPAEWGRVLITGTVASRRTDPATKRTDVTTELTIVGGEVPDQALRVQRAIWSDDPDNLDAPLHLTVSVAELGEVPDEDGTPLDRSDEWNDPLRWPLPDDVKNYVGSGQKAMRHAAAFLIRYADGGIGVNLAGLRAELGKLKHDRKTVERAWGALIDLGRLEPVNAASSAPTVHHHWMRRDGDPA